MKIPTECKMPDLSNLDTPLINRLLVKLLIGGLKVDKNLGLYIRNYIRLIDKAISEYKTAREYLLAQVAEGKRSAEEMQKGRTLYIIDFTNSIENCINAISRLYKLSTRVNSEKSGQKFPRHLQKLLNTKSDLVANFRNLIEHIDGYIQRGELPEGSPIMVTFNNEEDGIAIGEYNLKYRDLATVIISMNEIALYLLQIKPS